MLFSRCRCGVIFQELRCGFQCVAVVLFFKNLDVVFKVLWCCFSKTEISFSRCCCGVVIQVLRCDFQGVVVVLFFKNLDFVFNVLLWCCCPKLRFRFQCVAVVLFF
jgi:hypothetical protein